MPILRGIYSEFIKLRHTAVLWLHILIPVLGTALFFLYFALYPQAENSSKMALVLELTAIIFPIVISLVCGMMAALEEKAAGFQGMMSNKNGRTIPYLNKLLAAVLLGAFSTALLVGITMAGSSIFSPAQLPYRTFSLAALGMFTGSIPLYTIHMFLSIKWGLGCSVFIGVIECLLSIMISNVNAVIWPFMPCAWGVKILQSIISAGSMPAGPMFEGIGVELVIITVLSFGFLLLSFVWFQRWEGRKSFE